MFIMKNKFTKYIRNSHLCQINSHQKFQANEGLAGARVKCYNAAHKVLSSEPKLQLYLVHILSLKGLLTCQKCDSELARRLAGVL